MGLPSVEMPFQNGAIGLVDTPEDGIFGLVVSAESNPALTHNEVYPVKSLADCTQLGIIDTIANHFFYKFLKEFFAEAGDGTKLWIMPIPRTELMSDQFNPGISGVAPVQKMLDQANGEISILFTCFNPDNTFTSNIMDGMEADAYILMSAAQTFCENYTTAKASPLSVITEAYNFDGSPDLIDFGNNDWNRVQLVVGNTEKRTGPTAAKGSSLGKLAGRLAKDKVSTNPGRKKSGPLYDEQVYIKDTPVELFDVASLHDKNIVTFRTHLKTSGYFITDCPMACKSSDDYSKLTRRRVIDKAYRIGHAIASNELLEDFPLTSSGTVDPIYAKQIEQNIIDAIYKGMTLNGELSADLNNPKDKGCVCKVDLTYPTGSTGMIKFTAFQVATRGYAEMINIPIGFVPLNTN